LFSDHITKIWCRGDLEASAYTLNWLAHTLQFPEKKMGVALLVQGSHGAGKGVIGTIMRAIIGTAHYTHLTNISELLGKFNAGALEKCLLAVVDEVQLDQAKSKSQHSSIKTLITEDTHKVEQKFVASYRVNSYVNFCFLSNNADMMRVESGERRFFALQVADTYANQSQQSREYFDQLLKVSPKAVAHVLYSRDLSGFQCRSFPATKQLMLQKIMTYSSNSVERWLLKCMQAGELPGSQSALDLLRPPISLFGSGRG
jgi:hypothetical protein